MLYFFIAFSILSIIVIVKLLEYIGELQQKNEEKESVIKEILATFYNFHNCFVSSFGGSRVKKVDGFITQKKIRYTPFENKDGILFDKEDLL